MVSKTKILSVIIVLSMITTGLTFVSWNVAAGDSSKPFSAINGGAYVKVAWNTTDGGYALAVDGSADIYIFDRSTQTWAVDTGTLPGYVLNDIVYDSFSDVFFVVGMDSSNTPIAYEYYDQAPVGGLISLGGPSATQGWFNGVSAAHENNGASPYTLLAVGWNQNGVTALASWYNRISALWEPADTSGFATGAVLYDVTWDFQGGSTYYAVGENDAGYGIVVRWNTTGQTQALQMQGGWPVMSPLYTIDWNPDADSNNPHAAWNYDYAIMGGAPNANGNLFAFDGFSQPTALASDLTVTIEDFDWDPWGEEGQAVGWNSTGNSTGGKVYDIQATNQINDLRAVDVSYLLPDPTGELYGVSLKGYSSPKMGLIVGPLGSIGSSPSAFDVNTEITVNAAFPNLFDVDFWETGVGASLVNTAVDVEDNYTFYAEVNYTIGGVDQIFDGVNNTAIDFMVWYDNNGVNETGLLIENDMNRTRAFNVTWWEGDGGLNPEGAIITYPIASIGTDEFQLTGFNSGQILPFTNHWWITIDVYFGPQMRAADGGGGMVNSPDIKDAGLSFNDPNSWNFMIEVYDSAFPSAYDKGFEEFGVNRFTNVTASGNPTGNAPPGSVNIGLSPYSNITYASNDRYYVNISVENLVSGPNQIAATNLRVQLSSPIGTGPTSEIFALTFFAGANIPLSVWGNGIVPIVAPSNGTISHGPYGSDFNLYGLNLRTEVAWIVNVPGATPEGIYTGQITITVESY